MLHVFSYCFGRLFLPKHGVFFSRRAENNRLIFVILFYTLRGRVGVGKGALVCASEVVEQVLGSFEELHYLNFVR